ncbi:MAG: hypothetical protein A2Y75_01380 [Candidatus Solincola sediminis]|uniref:Vancomycin resistance protein n=1 Tax=Candidatus Solincola sediminis TaxID=1797199 RepID=A0A1F2WS27_9ACTN|nr:MAG: hypothetical protein A2Y75_01380 [Candidatus Solincola sediminis]
MGVRRLNGLFLKALPFQLRRELLSLQRFIRNIPSRHFLAANKANAEDFPFTLSTAASPLERVKGAIEAKLQKGKEKNVSIAAGRINNTLVEPGEIFSYHALVGRPSRLRGFKHGLELRNDEESAGIGGGLCQVSNMLYVLAISSGMRIVERHRHGLDLFPDHCRTVPFGCGATVCYNFQDLRFENPLTQPIMVSLEIIEAQLIGKIRIASDPGFRVRIEERGHRFFNENGYRLRENFIWRIISDSHGAILREELMAHNKCRVVY